jgi:ABC-type molybdate transport system permease subunit
VSARLALLAGLVATLIGVLLGLAHMRMGQVRSTLRAYLMLPMVAPHIVLATGMFSLLLHAHLLGNQWVLGMIHAALAVPLTMIVILNAADTVDPLLWTAASTLGARWWLILKAIVLPAMALSIVIALRACVRRVVGRSHLRGFRGPTATPTLPSRMFFVPEGADQPVADGDRDAAARRDNRRGRAGVVAEAARAGVARIAPEWSGRMRQGQGAPNFGSILERQARDRPRDVFLAAPTAQRRHTATSTIWRSARRPAARARRRTWRSRRHDLPQPARVLRCRVWRVGGGRDPRAAQP